MNIFLTGATGFVGRALVQRLEREGHRLSAWVRDPEKARALLGPQIKLLSTSEDDEALRNTLRDQDAVINLAGEPVMGARWTKARRRLLEDSRIATTHKLVDAIGQLANKPRIFISASAVGYYGSELRKSVHEDSPEGVGFLARLCGDWEHAAKQAEDHGLRVVLLRTGIVLGLDGGALPRLLPAFRAGLGGRLGSGEQAMPWIHIHDMLEIILAALHDERIEGAVNAVSPHPVSNREFSGELACVLGKRALVPVPSLALRAALGKAASVLLGGQRAVPSKLLRLGFEFRYPDLGPALHELLAGPTSVHISRAAQLPASPYLRTRGARYQMTQETRIAAPLEEVFAFFSRAENLERLTPANVGFTIDSPLPILMGTDARIDYTIRLGKIPMHWQTQIESWQPGRSFVDVQLSGPYRSWWHEHSFRQDGSETVMCDRVYYAPPLGVLGALAHRIFIASMLQQIFGYRSHAIAMAFARTPAARLPTRPALRVA